MRALRQLPWWFLVAMLIGLSGIAAGVALVVHGLHPRPAVVARTPTEDLPPSFPSPLPPAGPPEPVDTGYATPTMGGRPRSTPVRPAASHATVPSPYRTLSPSTARPSSAMPIPLPTGSPSLPTSR